MNSPLFRRQVLDQSTHPDCGRILLVRPLSHTLLTLWFAGLALGVLLFFFCFHYTRNIQVTGQLQPAHGLIRIIARQGGVITGKPAIEGQVVKAGDVLYELEDLRSSAVHDEVGSTIRTLLGSQRDSLLRDTQAIGQLAGHRSVALQRRLDDLATEIRNIDGQIALQQRRVTLAEHAVSRFRTLLQSGFVAQAALQDKQADWLDQQERLGELQRSRAASLREHTGTAAELTDLPVQRERDLAAARRSVARIEQDLAEHEAQQRMRVRSPGSGTVSSLPVPVGHTILAGQMLATLIPLGSPLEAELYAPSRAAGFIKPGMSVYLRYQAYPYQRFGQFKGIVKEVSGSTLGATELNLAGAHLPSPGQEPVYRIRVRLAQQPVTANGQHLALKPGMQLDAGIPLETRRLFEWILDPLYRMTGKTA